MKKLLVLFLIGSSLLVGSKSSKANEYDSFGIKTTDTNTYGIYGVNTTDGTSTLLTTKVFVGSDWDKNASFISSSTGEIMMKAGGTTYHIYNWKKNSWRDENVNNSGMTMFEKPTSFGVDTSTVQIGSDANDIDLVSDGLNINGTAVITKNADGSIQLGADDNNIDITSEGIAIDDEPLITKKANGELHIGKNSWITKEEGSRQKVYAKDAAGNPIPIDYTNGTKLLINGRDVEQSINNVGALSAALTGLPTVPTDTTLACGLGTGTHGGDFAFSGGCASKVNDKLAINYAASMTMPGQDYAGDFEDTFSARAGFVWELGKATKPTQISMNETRELKEEIADLKENNKNIIAQNNALLARLERLEKVALVDLKSKDLAVYKHK